MTRLGRAIGGATLLYGGVWPTHVTASFGAAAAAAKVLGLDAARTAGALASALARASALPSRSAAAFGFRYHALGTAAVEGCLAALAARAGIVADAVDIAGFERRIGAAVDAAALTDDLGSDWRVLQVDTKMLPSSRQALASIEAFLDLRLGVADVERIERITVAVPAAYRDMVDRGAPPAQRIESLIGVQYGIALAALHPGALYDALREKLPSGERIAALMARIDVQADAALSEHFPRRWGSRVTVRFGSGEAIAAEVLEPRGSGRRALDWDELRRKHERILAASGIASVDLTPPMRLCSALGDPSSRAAADLVAWLDARADAVEADRAP
jgi:2-methylcitrate dehydratase PrpD